jgi:hypothetical protein
VSLAIGNGDPLIEIFRNAFTFKRILQHPAPRHLSSVDNQSVVFLTSRCKSTFHTWCTAVLKGRGVRVRIIGHNNLEGLDEYLAVARNLIMEANEQQKRGSVSIK